MVSFWHLCVGLHRDHLDTCLGNPRRTFGRCARREEAHDREQVVLHPVLVLAGEKGTSRPVRDSRDSSRESQGDIFFCGKVEANVFLTCHFDCGMLHISKVRKAQIPAASGFGPLNQGPATSKVQESQGDNKVHSFLRVLDNGNEDSCLQCQISHAESP